MKHSQLHAIAHNYTDSMASGLGFVVGIYETDVFADAALNKNGCLTIDFLRGRLVEGIGSETLMAAIPVFQNGFDAFCQKHGASRSNFREFSVRFDAGPLSRRFVVTIEDDNGRGSSIEYFGVPGRRAKMQDQSGRVVPYKS